MLCLSKCNAYYLGAKFGYMAKAWLTLASIEAVVDEALFFWAIFDFLKGTQKKYWSFKAFVYTTDPLC